eukprot:2847078-Amphidinium_carterae.2
MSTLNGLRMQFPLQQLDSVARGSDDPMPIEEPITPPPTGSDDIDSEEVDATCDRTLNDPSSFAHQVHHLPKNPLCRHCFMFKAKASPARVRKISLSEQASITEAFQANAFNLAHFALTPERPQQGGHVKRVLNVSTHLSSRELGMALEVIKTHGKRTSRQQEVIITWVGIVYGHPSPRQSTPEEHLNDHRAEPARTVMTPKGRP